MITVSLNEIRSHAPLRRGSNEEMTMPTHCHNCRRPLSLAELASIEADPRVAEVVRYFGQAACNACCGKADAHGVKVASCMQPSMQPIA